MFYNAFVLLDGQCLLDNLDNQYTELMQSLLTGVDDDAVVLPFPMVREVFFNSVDVKTARDLYDKHWSRQPMQPLRDKVDMKKFFSLQVPKSYLNCTEDIALPPGAETGWCVCLIGMGD